jgi:hypothetical protein
MLPKLSSLRSLSLDSCQLADKDFLTLVAALPNLSLTSLSLLNNLFSIKILLDNALSLFTASSLLRLLKLQVDCRSGEASITAFKTLVEARKQVPRSSLEVHWNPSSSLLFSVIPFQKDG